MPSVPEPQSFPSTGGDAVREPDELVSCHTCLSEVPRSVATMAEGSDYLFYFCGAECFARWHGRPVRGRHPEADT